MKRSIAKEKTKSLKYLKFSNLRFFIKREERRKIEFLYFQKQSQKAKISTLLETSIQKQTQKGYFS